jgi:hypothetical protein
MCPLSIHDHPTRIARPESGQGPRRVVVKFRDRLFIPYEDGAQAKLTGEIAALWTHVTSQGPLLSTLRLDRLFTSTSARRIKDLVVLARHFDRGYVSPPDFLTYFVVDCPTLTVATDFAASLARSNHVERAYVQALPGPLPSPSVNPDDPEYAGQLYLQPARRGIDAPCSWAREYGAGQGVTFADIERAWNLDHEDLLNQDGTRRVTLEQFSENRSFVGECRHGTAVLGIVMATDNAKGCVGIAPWPLKALAIGEYRRLTASAPAVHNLPDAIMRAVELLGFGDVLLLETTQQLRVPSCEVPCELDPALGTQAGGAEGRTAYDLIRLATALGIAVIEPAGNGYKGDESKGVDFDGGDLARLARGDPAFLDSGAIIVAAAEPGVDPLALGGGNPAADTAHSPCKWSNFGKRVDCYAWGEYVNWLDWDEQSGLADYPRDFNGTSSASAIVAGVAVVVQGLARAMLGTPLSAWQLRALLHDGELGTASANPETDLIGVMPDLKKILARFDEGLVDIYVRDCVGDVGLPDPGPLAMSPDIIVRNAPVLDPQAAFGEGSGTEDDALLSEDVRYGQPQYVYVRARNRGIRASSPVKVEVFWAPPATLLTPSGWTRVGEPTVIPSVPGAGVLTVSPAITWPAADIPAAGHYCFVALISSAEDPAPTPSEFLDWEQYRAFVAGKNNVTWRNFNVVQPLPSPPVPLPPFGRCYEVDFRLVGPWNRRPRQMSLQVESDLPDGTLVEIQVSDAVASLLGLPPGRPDRDGEWRAVRFPPRGERRILAEAMLGRDLDAECRLRIRLPARAEARPHQIAILQLEQDRELGRITWRLVPGAPA